MVDVAGKGAADRRAGGVDRADVGCGGVGVAGERDITIAALLHSHVPERRASPSFHADRARPLLDTHKLFHVGRPHGFDVFHRDRCGGHVHATSAALAAELR